jgi:hypothetical protein
MAPRVPVKPLNRNCLEWGGEDSNLCRLAPADLQSAPIGQLGHLPNSFPSGKLNDPPQGGKARLHGASDRAGTGRAGEGTRTPNHLITNEMLYQLSYASSSRPWNEDGPGTSRRRGLLDSPPPFAQPLCWGSNVRTFMIAERISDSLRMPVLPQAGIDPLPLKITS